MTALDTARHHWEVLIQAWRDDRETRAAAKDTKTPGRDELSFLPAALEVIETPASPLGRVVAVTIMAFFLIAIVWSVFGRMDVIAVAQGRIIPVDRVKLIQPRDNGTIRAIHVSEGQHVEAGDLLVELDPTETEADSDRLQADLVGARIEMERLDALLQDDPVAAFVPPPDTPPTLAALNWDLMRSQMAERAARMASLDSNIEKARSEASTVLGEVEHLEGLVPRLRERVEARRDLMNKGIIPKLDFQEEEDELIDYEGRLVVEQRRYTESRAALHSAVKQREHAITEFERDIHTQLNEAQLRLSAIEQEIIKAMDRDQRQILRAPVAGTVQGLAVHTVGGVVTAAQQLMVIVPQDSPLEIEIMVLNKDSGFIRAGQPAEIKVESFPFTKYGTIDAEVIQVSADATEDEQMGLVYPARIAMARTTIQADGRTINLGPGMSVTVEIKTGKRRLIEYILAPLQRYTDESLRER